MVGDFVLAHPDIAGGQSYHNAGGMILHGPGAAEDRWDNDDIAIYETIGKKGELMLPGYKSMNIAKELYTVYGGEVDWLHQMRGVFTFTNELFTPFNYFRKPSDGGVFGKARGAATVQQVAPVRRRASSPGTRSSTRCTARSKSAGSRKTGFGSRRRSCWRRSATATWRVFAVSRRPNAAR